MFEKLAQIEKSYDELTDQISQPEFMSDMSVYAKLMKQHRQMADMMKKVSKGGGDHQSLRVGRRERARAGERQP